MGFTLWAYVAGFVLAAFIAMLPLNALAEAIRRRRYEQPERVRLGDDGDYQLAGFTRRSFAATLDAIIVVTGGATFFLLVEALSIDVWRAGTAGILLIITPTFAAYWYYWLGTVRGQTPGKRIAGVMVLTEDGKRPSRRVAMARTMGMYSLSSLFFGLGAAWQLWDSRRQTWHDKMAKTYVVVAAAGEVPRTEAIGNRE